MTNHQAITKETDNNVAKSHLWEVTFHYFEEKGRGGFKHLFLFLLIYIYAHEKVGRYNYRVFHRECNKETINIPLRSPLVER